MNEEEDARKVIEDLVSNQKDLDEESAKILRDNLWELYE